MFPYLVLTGQVPNNEMVFFGCVIIGLFLLACLYCLVVFVIDWAKHGIHQAIAHFLDSKDDPHV